MNYSLFTDLGLNFKPTTSSGNIILEDRDFIIATLLQGILDELHSIRINSEINNSPEGKK